MSVSLLGHHGYTGVPCNRCKHILKNHSKEKPPASWAYPYLNSARLNPVRNGWVWEKYNRMIWFAPDHGAHIDPQSGKGIHGDNIPKDMLVQHNIGIKPGKNAVLKPN
jgi:hypothetical protein